MSENNHEISDEEMTSLIEELKRLLDIEDDSDEDIPDFDAELVEAGWNVIRENPGIDCQEWINELIRQYPTEVVDALGNNPMEVFHTLADWWDYKEYTDPNTGEWHTLKDWAEYYATDEDDT